MRYRGNDRVTGIGNDPTVTNAFSNEEVPSATASRSAFAFGMRSYDSRANRVLRLLAALVFSVECIGLLAVIAKAEQAIAINPVKRFLLAITVVFSGFQINSSFDLVRALLFFASVVAVAALLGAASVVLWQSLGAGSHAPTRFGKWAVLMAVGANGLSVIAGVLVSPRLGGFALVGSILGAAILRQDGIRPTSQQFLRALAVPVVAVALGAASMAVDIGQYRATELQTHETAIPFWQGFWRVQIIHRPTAGTAFFASCGTPSDCVVVGEGSNEPGATRLDLTVSTDGGRFWKGWLIQSPSIKFNSRPLHSTCEGTSCLIMLYGYQGAVLVTTIHPHGSITGHLIEDMTASNEVQVSCPSVTWCAGIRYGYRRSSTGSLVVTANAGRTDQRGLLPPPLGTNSIFKITSLGCSVAQICVVGGIEQAKVQAHAPVTVGKTLRGTPGEGTPRVSVTSDGGRSWSTGNLPSGLASGSAVAPIDCLPSMTCWAAVSRSGSATALMNSSDGGRTWKLVALPGDWDHASAPQLTCTSARICLLTGTSEARRSGRISSYVAFRTTDAGVSWQRAVLPRGRFIQWVSPSCDSSGQCIAPGLLEVDETGSVGKKSVITMSHNGGLTWGVQPFPMPRVPGPRALETG